MNRESLSKEFFCRDPAVVARDLIGKILFRRLPTNIIEGIIVETEAYYGSSDPASRAYRGVKNYNRLMWDCPGKIFIYNVHKYWMFNIVAHQPGKVGAVLLRSIEPVSGIGLMKERRGTKNVFNLTSGPGKLTIALDIDKHINGAYITDRSNDVFITENVSTYMIHSSHRIGVKKDLEENLRFFVKGNRYVSRR